MRWTRGYKSNDVIDRRGEPGGVRMGGIGGLLPLLFRGKYGWIMFLILGGAYLLQNRLTSSSGSSTPANARNADERADFVAFVLDDAQSTWTKLFSERGKPFERAKLVLFTDATQTACGFGQAATGPFYCPADRRAYLDLGFFGELERRLGARGDFAQAYVVAHEIGHHVQNLLGLTSKVKGSQAARGAEGASVRLELQADCFAGIWAHSTQSRDLLEKGDLEEAIGAAAAIGDDRLQRDSSGTVAPDSFTHGTSEQRSRWFRRGYEAGKLEACDTFAAAEL